MLTGAIAESALATLEWSSIPARADLLWRRYRQRHTHVVDTPLQRTHELLYGPDMVRRHRMVLPEVAKHARARDMRNSIGLSCVELASTTRPGGLPHVSSRRDQSSSKRM